MAYKKASAAFSRPVSRWVPDTLHGCCLLLSSLLIWDHGPPQLFTGATLQRLLETLYARSKYAALRAKSGQLAAEAELY